MKRTSCLVVPVLLLVLLLGLSGPVWSDERAGGGFGMFFLGSQGTQLDDLNRFLQTLSGYETFRSSYFALGGGGYGIIYPWLIGGEGFGVLEQTASGMDSRAKLLMGAGFFNVGRLLYSRRSGFLYALAGFGGGHIELTVSRKTVPASVAEAFAGPGHSTVLQKDGMLLQVGIGGQKVLPIGAAKRKGDAQQECGGGLLFGFQVGYVFPFGFSKWKVDEQIIGATPEVDFRGPYVRISIGGIGYCFKSD